MKIKSLSQVKCKNPIESAVRKQSLHQFETFVANKIKVENQKLL